MYFHLLDILIFLKSAWAAPPKAVTTGLTFLCRISISTNRSFSLLRRSLWGPTLHTALELEPALLQVSRQHTAGRTVSSLNGLSCQHKLVLYKAKGPQDGVYCAVFKSSSSQETVNIKLHFPVTYHSTAH